MRRKGGCVQVKATKNHRCMLSPSILSFHVLYMCLSAPVEVSTVASLTDSYTVSWCVCNVWGSARVGFVSSVVFYIIVFERASNRSSRDHSHCPNRIRAKSNALNPLRPPSINPVFLIFLPTKQDPIGFLFMFLIFLVTWFLVRNDRQWFGFPCIGDMHHVGYVRRCLWFCVLDSVW